MRWCRRWSAGCRWSRCHCAIVSDCGGLKMPERHLQRGREDRGLDIGVQDGADDQVRVDRGEAGEVALGNLMGENKSVIVPNALIGPDTSSKYSLRKRKTWRQTRSCWRRLQKMSTWHHCSNHSEDHMNRCSGRQQRRRSQEPRECFAIAS